MAKITYIEFSGTQHIVDVAPNVSVMKGAVDNKVRGILADCGGSCACATCHVYVDPAWVDRVGEKGEQEALMLEDVFDPQENSRLSCQIKVTSELDGLVIRLPQRQI